MKQVYRVRANIGDCAIVTSRYTLHTRNPLGGDVTSCYTLHTRNPLGGDVASAVH